MKYTPIQFMLNHRLGYALSYAGNGKWKINHLQYSAVLNKKTLIFEREVFPSERSEDYLVDRRFDSVVEAIEFYETIYLKDRYFIMVFDGQKKWLCTDDCVFSLELATQQAEELKKTRFSKFTIIVEHMGEVVYGNIDESDFNKAP